MRERGRSRTGFFFAASGPFTPLLGACSKHKNKPTNQKKGKKQRTLFQNMHVKNRADQNNG